VCVWRVCAGAHFTLLVTSAGVLSFGANGFGQLGRETEMPHDNAPAPVELACLAADGNGSARGCVRDVSCGDESTHCADAC
jgi:alpha-tubulin suppressor-like RCC1 family protein